MGGFRTEKKAPVRACKSCRLFEQRGEGQAQGQQQWGGELLLGFKAQDRGLPIAAIGEAVNFHLIKMNKGSGLVITYLK